MDISLLPFTTFQFVVFSYYSTTRLRFFCFTSLFFRRTNSTFPLSLLNFFFCYLQRHPLPSRVCRDKQVHKHFQLLSSGCAVKKTVRNTKWVMNCCVRNKEGSFNVLHCSLYPWSSCNNFSVLASLANPV